MTHFQILDSGSCFILHPSSLDSLAQRKAFLLRIDPQVLEAVQRWANDELRSLNGQIEYLLRRALKEAKRDKTWTPGNPPTTTPPQEAPQTDPGE
ncbi:hypothetical protein [Fontivita pretiosa]|uniref:hypothetical protein n=1 Tax=Fontivita pretiosa TaxID=2989684 RepID=UPI003D18488E